MSAGACAIALKEWAILCHALATGRQSFLVRKGGILDRAAGGFKLEQRAFFLFPTYFHEKRADVLEEARADFDALSASAPPPTEAALSVYAEVVDARFVDERAALHRLAPHHLYTERCLDARYDYREPGAWVVLLRAFVLPAPHVVSVTAEQAGCVSWVHLDAPLSTAGARPVLSEEQLEAARAFLDAALGEPGR